MITLSCKTSSAKWATLIKFIAEHVPMTSGIVKITLEYRNGTQTIITHDPHVK